MDIGIAYYRSPIGTMEIKSMGDAISNIVFVDAINEAEIDFGIPEIYAIKNCIEQLDGYFSGAIKNFTFPTTQAGTKFQQKVWNELRNIPFGKTISYLELSKRTGDTKAIRAVGTANGKNTIWIAVPCHRVIGSNGSLTGYAGGLWRKKWLLEHEAKSENGGSVQTLF